MRKSHKARLDSAKAKGKRINGKPRGRKKRNALGQIGEKKRADRNPGEDSNSALAKAKKWLDNVLKQGKLTHGE
jgi:hypothetical protein